MWFPNDGLRRVGFLFVCLVEALRPSQQFFSHVGTDLGSPFPTMQVLSKLLILIGCHGNRNA